MWLLKIVLVGGVVILLFVGVFGGVLDVASLVGVSISQWGAIAIAAGLLVLEREVKVLVLSWKLNARRDLQRRIDKLAEFRSEGITTLYATAPSAQEFSEWTEVFKAWENSLVSYLEQEFPYAVFEIFKDLGMIPQSDFTHLSSDPTIKDQHHHYLNMIAKILITLEMLIQENTSLTKEREPRLAELLSSGPSAG